MGRLLCLTCSRRFSRPRNQKACHSLASFTRSKQDFCDPLHPVLACEIAENVFDSLFGLRWNRNHWLLLLLQLFNRVLKL